MTDASATVWATNLEFEFDPILWAIREPHHHHLGIHRAILTRDHFPRTFTLSKITVAIDLNNGSTIHDRYYADKKVSPNPSLAPLDQAPYYALRCDPGDLDTKGGLKCDEYARVLDTEGNVIEGLYAAGNASAAVMGDTYPGAGATIGSAMTFAYIAAQHAFGNRPQETP